MMVLIHSAVPAVVLVVEDEMLLRMRAVDMVEDAGFTSVEALDADEAVAILESRSDIALLFTDIQMPGSMDGLKLAHAVRERWPPTVSAIASQSSRNVPGAEHAQHAIEGRLLALGRAHDLLLQARRTSANLAKIVRGATEAFDNPDVPKFTIAGPDVRMTSGAVIAIAMPLNELCTNTTKFGALSVPAGRVDIEWTLDPKAQRLHLKWTEKNGPAVLAPDKRSFGTRLIETLGKQLKGDVRLTYEPGGFVYEFDVPLASLAEIAPK
jgi:two-component sensor histidine kinase